MQCWGCGLSRYAIRHLPTQPPCGIGDYRGFTFVALPQVTGDGNCFFRSLCDQLEVSRVYGWLGFGQGIAAPKGTKQRSAPVALPLHHR